MRTLVVLLAACLLSVPIAACGSSSPQPEPTVTVTAAPSSVDDVQAGTEANLEEAVREGVGSIQIGLQSWSLEHDDAYPEPELVNEADMAGYVETWPTNPYTGLPMENIGAPGDFSYSLTEDGGFEIVGYGADGQVVVTAP